MKTFNNLDEAVNSIIESSQKHAKATQTGDYKTANLNYAVINSAVTYLKEKGEIEKLKELLAYNDLSVKLWVASYLIKQNDQKAAAVLEEISAQSIRHHSFHARMVLQDWRKGKLF
ncbi:hypothetical protein [Mucilaginibacter paludis]|uniref:DUF2019 domain-containing protein n=1 Tax=Mucilaginibacter paludis DSM 18603 TaxID=714943 RepID=H1YC67_9SPHI|nr:hypothetical protein [Mucilaginibacter paludis]EHQ29630.1 hypothetical protein Mucpa_5559 [Mucilaginibacter paludis DSM 18603]